MDRSKLEPYLPADFDKLGKVEQQTIEKHITVGLEKRAEVFGWPQKQLRDERDRLMNEFMPLLDREDADSKERLTLLQIERNAVISVLRDHYGL